MAAERTKKRVGKKIGRHTKTRELATAERRAKVTELKLSGMSYREIARTLGCSIGTVATDVAAALEAYADRSVNAVRREGAITMARIDRAISFIWSEIEDGNLEAIDRLDRLEKHRRAVIGLDAPKKTEVTGGDGGPVIGGVNPESVAALVREQFGEHAAQGAPTDIGRYAREVRTRTPED